MPRAPQKINNLIIFDWETSGIDKKEGKHSQKYAVTEFAGIGFDTVSCGEIIRYDNLVKPYDDKLIYDPGTVAINGITKEMCIEQGVDLKVLVNDIVELAKKTNIHNSKTARPTLVAHNGLFDRMFIQDVFERCNVDMSKYIDGDLDSHGRFVPSIIDTIDLCKWLWGDITDTDTKFKLGACLQKAGIDISDSHRAINDVIALTDLVAYIITRLRSGSSEVSVTGGVVSVHRQNFEW